MADARAIKFGLSKLAVLTTRPGRLVALHLRSVLGPHTTPGGTLFPPTD